MVMDISSDHGMDDFVTGSVTSGTAVRRRSILADLGPRDWGRIGGLLVILAALMAWEFMDGRVGAFLSSHPLFGGIFTAVLLTVMTISGFEALRSHWEADKWRRLSTLAMLSIAYDLTIMIDVFIWLVTGARPTNTFSPSNENHSRLSAILRREGLPEMTDPDFGKINHKDYGKRLNSLVSNDDWLRLALSEIDLHKAQHRRSIALWVPSMAFNPHAAAVLDRVVAANDLSSHVQQHLRRISDTTGASASGPLTESWFDFLGESISLREDLWAASRGRLIEWQIFRRLLPQSLQTEMSGRDTKDIREIIGEAFRQAPST